ncbi:hypothetical protein FH972_006199 [Carpinus fangiana]|uniref:Rx N-terminal domain-containing protein n=1 Tax=Carpinus fangiana TaxID=176857 RepID=A0A5N6QUI2_9ROSI|nr:hypothetical protein FH972_006199 [Carpinus fangiana]
MAEIAVTYLLDKLTSLTQEEVKLLKGVKEAAASIEDELEQIEAFLRAADQTEKKTPQLEVWVKQVRDVAYDIEDALDEYRLHLTQRHGNDFHVSLAKIIKTLNARHQFGSEIQRIKSRVVNISEARQRLIQGEATVVDSKTWLDRRQDGLLLEEADLVGIEKPKKQLVSWLIPESWTLFCRKTFGDQNPCPPDLKGLAESILGRCEGLPLAIVALSGVLATKNTPEQWDLIQRCLADELEENSKDQNFVVVVRGQNVINWPEKVRRLSIQKPKQDVQQSQSISRLRSLLIFRTEDSLSLSESSKPISFPLDFKLLNVLDLRGAPLEIFPNEIVKLLLLKYLSLRATKIKTIPSSIESLQNLETLDLKHACVTALPAEISQLQKLRHLLAMPHVGNLRCLQKLCFVEADHGGNELMKELGSLKQLRRLGIVNFRRENGVALCSSIENLTNLRALSITSTEENEIIDVGNLSSPPPFLQLLYLTGRLEKLPHWISSLHSLAKVSLKWSQLMGDYDPLQPLQDLPNLVHLEFLQVYEGDTLHFKAQGFQKLKVLGLANMDGLKTVDIEMGAMPLLEKLILQRCKLLQKLPSGIEHLKKLKLLEFFDMPYELILTIRPDIEGEGDYWKVENVSEINSTYWRDGGWDVYSLERSIEGESSAPTRMASHELPSYWK